MSSVIMRRAIHLLYNKFCCGQFNFLPCLHWLFFNWFFHATKYMMMVPSSYLKGGILNVQKNSTIALTYAIWSYTCGVSLAWRLPGISVDEHLQLGSLHASGSHGSAKGNAASSSEESDSWAAANTTRHKGNNQLHLILLDNLTH